MIAENRIYSVGSMEPGKYLLEAVQLVALLINQITGKDNKVCFLLIHQLHQMPDSFRIPQPAAYMYIRQLKDAITVKAFGYVGRAIFDILYLKACDTRNGSVKNIGKTDYP